MGKLLAPQRIFASLLLLIWIVRAQGQCQYERQTYLDGESWKSENCRFNCTCEDSSTFCEPLTCGDPGCDFSAGEFLVFTENDPCCPVCDGNHASCKYQAQYFLEGTKWTTSTCELCDCSSGVVSCVASNCSPLHCTQDDVPLQLRNECCPQCLPYKSTCIVDGVVYRNGERWAPNQCMLCQCEDGRHVCYVSVCPSLVCAQDEMLKTFLGECCPQCVKFQCEQAGIRYQDGDFWFPDSCTFCSCSNSSVTCQRKNCAFTGACAEGQELIQKTGSCCPSCVSRKDLCHVGDEIYVDGEIWKSPDCRICLCRSGQTYCQKINCPLESCQMGESKIQEPDQCCPVCRPTRRCNFNGLLYENEDIWAKDDCTLCSCKDGNVICFAENCLCDKLDQPYSRKCCLTCETSSCDTLCKSCKDTNHAYCTECLESQLVLHHGKCLFDCEPGYFVNERKQCQLCHPTCSKCFGELPSQCLSCQRGRLLKKGYCAENCGLDFFEENDKCIPCHPSCSQCEGSGEDQCLACTLPGQLLQNGRCTDYCTGHFYIADGNCFACNATCARCLKDGSCQFCHEEEPYLENNLCVEFCSSGHYIFMDAYCLPCHPTCLACYGPKPNQCIFCPFGLYLLDNSCVSDCGQGYYRDQGGGVCSECHPDCRLCLTGSADDQCLSCSSGYFLPYKLTSFGRCVKECSPQHYLTQDGKCEECYQTCESCFGPNDTDCLSCKSSFYLKNNKCVLHCSTGFFTAHEDNTTCYACHPTCSTCDGWGNENCLSCHPGNVLVNGRCTSTCTTDEFLDSDGICKPCHPTCQACVGNLSSNESSCVQCRHQQYYTLGEECVPECSQNFYGNSYRGCEECHNKCATCERGGANSCTSCWAGHFLSVVGTCVPNCQQGYFAKNGICEECGSNCFRCSDNGRCEQCVGKYVLQSGKCVSKCSDRQFVDSASRQCKECSSDCKTCIGPSSEDCFSCMPGKLLLDGTCVEVCTEGYYEEEGECQPCDLKCRTCYSAFECESCHLPLLLLNGECVSDCGSGKYADWETSSCSSCPSHCTNCLSPDECGLCDFGFYLYQKRCVPDCPASHYSDSLWRICEKNEHAPQLLINSTLIVGVGSTVPINVKVLSVIDEDTDFNNIKFIVVERPQNGALIRKSDDGGEIILEVKQSFEASDLLDGWIFFKHFRNVPLSGHLVLKVSDRQLDSPGILMPIQVVSHDPPIVKQKEPLIAYSGTETVISSDSLYVSDRDNLEDVILQVIQGPHQGILTYAGEKRKLTEFTALELLNHQIAYKHLDSQRLNRDAVIFRATDGYNFKFLIYTVFIVPEDAGEPAVVVNKPVYVKDGLDVPITSENLYAADKGSDASHIHFSLQGSSTKTMGGFLSKAGGKKLRERIKKFTQQDINRNLISYHHENPEILNATMRLKVTSSRDPIRHFALVDFQIYALISNFTPLQPEISNNYGIMVLENHAATLSSSNLPVRYEGIDAKDTIYEITKDLNPDEGVLEHRNHPGDKLVTFTQADIESSKIVYRPPPKSVPKEQFHFHFIVRDAVSGFQLQPVQKFTISIIPMNNPASLSFDYEWTVRVDQGSSVLLGSNVLSTTGHQIPIDNLEVVITKAPLHGDLVQVTGSASTKLVEGDGDSFTSFLSDLFYFHDGSNTWKDEAVFTIRGGQHTSRNLLNIDVKPVDKESPVILDSSTLMGVVTEGDSFVIKRENLAYTDAVSGDGDITFTLLSSLKYGNLEKLIRGRHTALKPKDAFTQQDINEFYMRYKAREDINESTGKTLREFVYLNVTDGSGNIQPNQVFTVKIKPKVRRAPSLTVLADIHVDEGGSAIFGSHAVEISDPDSRQSDLVIVVDQSPKYGYLKNSRPTPGAEVPLLGLPVYRFPYIDFLEGFINYTQDSDLSQEPTWDYFMVHVSDGNLKSPSLQINVTIKPINDEAPVISTQPLYVSRGGIAKITNSSILVADADNSPSDLTITLESTPMRGEIMKFGKSRPRKKLLQPLKKHDKFTFQEILDELIVYGHDNSQGLVNDSFRIAVYDGLYRDYADLIIIITDFDKESPFLDVNRGLELEAGTKAIITNALLHASDEDSDNDLLIYEITADPSSGHLIMLENDTSVVLTVNGPLKTFSQMSLDLGHLRYVHNEGDPGGVHFFKFNVQDPAGNSLLDQSFIITVKEDVLAPSVIRNAGIRVTEGGSELITTDHLFVNDTDSNQEKLAFFVSSGPNLGHLELHSHKGKHMSEFDWTDLVTQNIRYVHTSETEDLSDSFIFKVSDGKNYAIQTFHITILPVDDSLPHVTVKPLRVSEGSSKTITPFELKVQDLDTEDSLLSIRVRRFPLHGLILHGISDGRNVSVSSFSMEDIYEGKISYLHDGSDSVEDSFQFTVSDGTNPHFVFVNGNNKATENPVVFWINILPIDDSVPVLSTNIGLRDLISTEGQHWNEITKYVLHTTDADTEPFLILYTITQEPTFGILELVSHSGQRVTSFTQEDINQNSVRYVLIRDDLSTTEDSFTFDVQDTGRNVLKNNVFRIFWSRINFTFSSYNVSETDGLLKIGLMRSGSTYKNSFVQCEVLQPTYVKARAQSGDDFELISSEVAFEGAVKEKYFTVRIHDDVIYEGMEGFSLQLRNPSFAILGVPSSVHVSIHDDEDQPSIGFQENLFTVEETQNYLSVPVYRTGDTSKLASVTCSTLGITAKGSGPRGLETGSDFISRFITDLSELTFPPGVSQTTCDIKIIDDSFYEEEEEFELILSDPYPRAKLAAISRARIMINGPNDVPLVSIASPAYIFKENAGEVKLEIVRTGPDLSQLCTVMCNTASSSEIPAYPGEDYAEKSTKITFGTDQSFAECPIVILDDSPEDKVEGDEMFVVFLSNPVGCDLGKLTATTITIQDEESDVPQIQFRSNIFVVEETVGMTEVPVIRTGDLGFPSSVRCITRQDTASVDEDFVERTDTDESLVIFAPGEMEGLCNVQIIDDTELEGTEYFQLKLTPGNEYNDQNINIGSRNSIVIEIRDQEDATVVELENVYYVIEGPKLPSDSVKISVGVVRTGDLSRHSRVRISTQDGSATSGVDYHAVSRQLGFEIGERRKDMEVEILYSNRRRWNLSFNFFLNPDDLVNAELGNNTEATVTITDNQAPGSSILPATPLVVSLLHYDDVEKGMKMDPSAGYPLVCVTPCDPKYPSYEATESLCKDSGINMSSLFFTWEIAMPRDVDGSMSRFHMITDDTLFTSVHRQVLDSIYFRCNVWIRCLVQPKDASGIMGVPLRSKEVKISSTNGICHTPIIPGHHHLSLQAQSFAASLNYVKSANKEHHNRVHIRVEIPHQDGMLPLISTFPLYNIRHLLTQGIYRHQHVCSNLHFGSSSGKTSTNNGFLQKEGFQGLSKALGYHLPYQFDNSMREGSTLALYRHLNLKNCTWTFDAWYHMTELVDLCGGIVTSDFKTRDSGQTFVSVQLPFYVSYVFSTMPTGWTSLEHKTELECSFFYNTVLWKTGLQTEDTLRGVLQVSRLGINRNGQLFFEFKTEAKFKGLFVLSHHTLPGVKSRVIPPNELDVNYLLELLWSDRTFDGPTQLWKATSTYNLKDYSGLYIVELIPCRVATTQMYGHFVNSSNIPCTAYSPQRFEIPLAFQQTNRPVPLTYSLNTVFQLLNNEKLFFLDPFGEDGDVQHVDYKGTFSLGDMVFGKVFWSPDQDLKSAYELRINKVIICARMDGYGPTYDPTGNSYGEGPQYGCIQSTKNIKHSFIILDRNNPDAEDKSFYDVPFEAKFLDDLLRSEVMSPGTDGFAFKVDALYKVNSGYQWFLQVMYTIGPSTRRLRRSAPPPPSNNLLKDEIDPPAETAPSLQSHATENGMNGTNIRAIRLDISEASVNHLASGEQRNQGRIQNEKNEMFLLLVSVLTTAVVVLLIATIFIKLKIVLRRRRYESQTRGSLRLQSLNGKRQIYYIEQPTNDVLQIGLTDSKHSYSFPQTKPFTKPKYLTQKNGSLETDV